MGHNGKVSMVSVDDYAPNEIPRIFSPPQDELDKFYYKNKNMVADSDTYLVLK